jgi:hypothetical protein
MSHFVWTAKINEFLCDLPAETLVTVVDCHI